MAAGSEQTILPALWPFKAKIVQRPTGPPPRTTAVSPGLNLAQLTACHATDKGSTNAARSKDKWSGTFNMWSSPYTTYWPKAPWSVPKPTKLKCLQQFGLLALHAAQKDKSLPCKSALYLSLSEQWDVASTTTRSPGLTLVTPEPTESTTPENSCPGHSGNSLPEISLLQFGAGKKIGPSKYSCKSVPQIPQYAILTLTSLWFLICGSSISSEYLSCSLP